VADRMRVDDVRYRAAAVSEDPELSFVIPILDEREILPELHRRLVGVMDQLDVSCEVVIVDDGSTDGSPEVVAEINGRDPRIKLVRLSRNFGHQIAITAGLDHARGQAVIIMDGDLQDPPEVAIEMVQRWREGFQVVYAVRDERAGETQFKLTTARWFYRILGRMSEVRIPEDAGDFRLVDRTVVDAVGTMREHRRYLRGMFAWVGYDQVGVTYSRAERHAGKTKFPLHRMLAFASDGIVSFSAVPLRIALNVGFLTSVLSLMLGVVAVILKLAGVYAVPGWASIVVVVGVLGGVQLTVLGVMGEYIARIHDEVKQRPLYIVREEIGVRGTAPVAGERPHPT
jgi:polyisoprenyl-phosphate glycosyltransferase